MDSDELEDFESSEFNSSEERENSLFYDTPVSSIITNFKRDIKKEINIEENEQ